MVPRPGDTQVGERAQADAAVPAGEDIGEGAARSRAGDRSLLFRPTLWVPVFLAGFVYVTLDVLLGGPLRSADHEIDRWVVQYVPHSVVMVCRRYVVLPGQRLVDVPPMAAAAAVLAWRRRQWRPLLVPLVVMVFLAIIVPALKLWTGRTNPISGGDHLWRSGPAATEYPSGHEINAIVVWGMCFAMCARLDWPVGRWLTRSRRVLLTSLMAVWVGCAVMVARTHWFSDVVASLCIAIPLLWAVLRFGFTSPRRR